MITTLFFDCDGVLIDSESIHFEAHRQALREAGITITRSDYLEDGVSTSSVVFYEKMAKAYGVTIDPVPVHARKRELYNTLAHSAELFPSVQENILELSKRYTLYIVSSSHKDTISQLPALREILPCFKDIISAHDVERGKPFPDVYLHAIKVASVPADQCVAIEDSATGISAAIDANLRCIAIPNTLTEQQDLSRASQIISTISELTDEAIQGTT